MPLDRIERRAPVLHLEIQIGLGFLNAVAEEVGVRADAG